MNYFPRFVLLCIGCRGILSHLLSPPVGVTGGFISHPFQFPHSVSLFYKDKHGPGGVSHWCTGALLNSKTILTAAHCAWRSPGSIIPPPIKDSFAVTGTNNASHPLDAGFEGDVWKLCGATIHPMWRKEPSDCPSIFRFYHDVALISLCDEIPETKTTRYLNILDEKHLHLLKPRVPPICIGVAGWGLYVDEETHRVCGDEALVKCDYQLRSAFVPLQDPSVCDALYNSPESCPNQFNSTLMSCVGSKDGTGICSGDSGSSNVIPLEKFLSSENEVSQPVLRYTAVSVTSFQAGSCGQDGDVAGMTLMPFHEKWIWSQVEKPPPPDPALGEIKYVEQFPLHCPKDGERE